MDTWRLATKLAEKHRTRNPFRIAEDLGIIVIKCPLVGIRGFQQRIKRRKIIYVNSELDDHQQEIVCAHELGHIFLHSGMNRIFLNQSTNLVAQKFENEANFFSVDLIFSDDDLIPLLEQPLDVAAAAMGVSTALALHRLRYIDQKGSFDI